MTPQTTPAQTLRQLLADHADASNAEPMARYMKNHFPFFGIKSPERRDLLKIFLDGDRPPQYADAAAMAWELWQMPERECQYCAVEILATYKRQFPKEAIDFFAQLLVHKSWWDASDAISSALVAPYFRRFPAQVLPVTEGWMASGNLWLQRVCLIFQLSYKRQTNRELLEKYIKQLNDSPEFFIQKAIGWALRQYARVDADWVKTLVETTPLKPLSVREAMKHLT